MDVDPSAPTRPSSVGPLPLVIATILRPSGGTGVQTHFRELQRFLDREAIPSTLVTPFSWHPLLSGPVFGIRLPLARLRPPASVAWYLHFHEVFLRKALRRHLKRNTDAVVYAQDPIAAGAALLARRSREQRVVMGVHFKTSLADEWADRGAIARHDAVFRAIRTLERQVIPRLDGIVYVAKWAQQDLLAWLPEADCVPSAVMPNFIETPSVQPVGACLGDLVTVGSLEVTKNHRFLLEVLACAKRAGRTLTLDIFGDGSCRRELKRLASALGVAHQVKFHGFRPDVRELLARYRIYVHASYSEALPFAIIEAMSVGLPIVAYAAGGIPELCEPGVEARYWQLDDPNGAASILLGLLDSETSRSALGAAAAARFRRTFASETVAPRLFSFLQGDGGYHANASSSRPGALQPPRPNDRQSTKRALVSDQRSASCAIPPIGTSPIH